MYEASAWSHMYIWHWMGQTKDCSCAGWGKNFGEPNGWKKHSKRWMSDSRSNDMADEVDDMCNPRPVSASVKTGPILTCPCKTHWRRGQANRCTKPRKLQTMCITYCWWLAKKHYHFSCFGYAYQALGDDNIFVHEPLKKDVARKHLMICNR